MRTLKVDLANRSYPIHIGPGVRSWLSDASAGLRDASQLAVIVDQTVARLHMDALLAALPAQPRILTFASGETAKSLASVERLCEQLAEARMDRDAVIIAFGGGVAGDLAGFVAASWLRGVRFVQVPTTLLAAVDASVGGKTGVNLATGKNLIGAFHQPIAVVIDTEFQRTLPTREFAAGLAESVKHAAIRDPDFLDWHEDNAERILAQDGDLLAELIARNCEIKADIVARDEREADLRAILNYGHTVGHAIEHLLNYELRHGECIGLGMLVENEVACERGWLSRPNAGRIRALLAKLGLLVRLPRPLSSDAVWSICQGDKKVRGGAVHFVLLRDLGQPERIADVSPAEVATALEHIQLRSD
ncbi:MAG: 3-dehydroquinate synthase [Phycisphaerae bacterium]|nr:3-dehydroquinate synthase [Phycisphaerae bacterium]